MSINFPKIFIDSHFLFYILFLFKWITYCPTLATKDSFLSSKSISIFCLYHHFHCYPTPPILTSSLPFSHFGLIRSSFLISLPHSCFLCLITVAERDGRTVCASRSLFNHTCCQVPARPTNGTQHVS